MPCLFSVTNQRLSLLVAVIVGQWSSTASQTNSTATDQSGNTTTSQPLTFAPAHVPVADVNHDLQRSVYTLRLRVGYNNSSSDIFIQDIWANSTELLLELKTFLGDVTSAVDLQSNPDPTTDNEYNLLLEFRHDALGVDKQASLSQAFERMESSTRLRPEFNITSVLDDFFASTTAPCNAHYVCPLGFTCNRIGCQHMCNQDNVCSGHGDCVVGVTSTVHVEISCRCHSDFSTHYSGDQCQDSRMGDGQVTAIVAGILGSICLTLVIVVVWLCVGSNSKSSYAFSGDVYSNSTYEHSTSKD